MALVLDGKTFAEATMVVALGITMTGDKRFLGVVETDTENEKVFGERGLGLPGASGDRGWRRGSGRPSPPPRPGATVSVAQARERGELL